MNIIPLDFNYIDGLNTYPIQEYIDEKIITNITSNIYTSNIIIGNNQYLNDNIYYINSNLYFKNGVQFGDIFFKTSYIYPNDSNFTATKIDFTGKLKVYHNYNILQPTFAEGYYDVEDEIIKLMNDGILTDIQLTALEATTVALQTEINDIIIALNQLEGELAALINNIYYSDTYQQFRNLSLLTDFGQYQATYASTVLNIQSRASALYNSSFANGLLVSLGLGIAGAVLSAGASYFYYEKASNALMTNMNFTNTQKSQVYNDNLTRELSTYSNLYNSTSNLSFIQGFINSNIQSEQFINNLKCNSITLNNKTINKFSLDNLDDWVKTTNGIYYDITNGTLAINSTPTTTDFFRVGGQTTIQGDIIGETKIKITNINQAFPSVGINGGNGDRLILKAGTATTYPVSFGFSGLDLWYSVPAAVSHRFYVNGSLITSIFSGGLSTTGYINASTNLRENGVNISSKYLLLSGGSMTGQITGVTTLNGTTGIFGTLQTTNNTNVAAPSLGIAGGIGDKFILYSGSASAYPYSFGINNNELWYSAPLGASHKFYNNGNNILTLNSSGDITISGSMNITSANQFLTFGQRGQDNLIKLWTDGTNTFGIGINASVLRYNVPAGSSHIFYTGTNNTLQINSDGHLISPGYIYAGGTTSGLRINGNDYGNTIYQGATTISGNAANIGFTLRDANSFNFQSFSTAGAYTTIASLNTTNGLSLFGNIIYNYLFNNNGVSHESSITNFNNVSKFGYQYVLGNTNGPGTPSTFNQYYQWFIGLGINYGVNSHGCQFALPRNTSDPILSVRFKEDGSWGSWTNIRAGSANTLTSGNKTIDGLLTCSGITNLGPVNFNGVSAFNCYGPALFDYSITCRLSTTANQNPHDYVGVIFETPAGSQGVYMLYLILNSFTGIHRNFTNDQLFDENEPQLFKDNYEGRIVISTGKIATQIGNQQNGYEIRYDKDGIYVEDAHPVIQLSKIKKDKRVFGVLGRRERKNSDEKRLIINSIGEGAIWISNSNGNIENGDYIQSSNYLGYGEKQSENYLCNYTVAKALIDCDFELDSPYYNCYEIEDLNADGNKLRVAFIAVTYHCG